MYKFQVCSDTGRTINRSLAPNTECNRQSVRGVLYEQMRCSSIPPTRNARPIRVGHPRPIPAFFTIYGSTLTRRGLPLPLSLPLSPRLIPGDEPVGSHDTRCANAFAKLTVELFARVFAIEPITSSRFAKYLFAGEHL